MIYGVTELAKLLSRKRRALGLSQSAVAEQIGGQQSYIGRFESGKHDIRLSRFIELARILEMEVLVVPKEQIPLIKALLRSRQDIEEARPLYTLDQDEDDG